MDHMDYIDYNVKNFKKMTDNQLVEFINDMMYYIEIPYALDELAERAPQKAFEVGMDILIKDEGDDFLQACVLGTCASINSKKALSLITQRVHLFGWCTLETMLLWLISNPEITDSLPEHKQQIIKQQIVDSYNNIREEEKRNELSEMFNDFLKLTQNI